jgi:peptidoglycan hydrolase-like protein with peptidoglycan-binding domain
MTMTSTNRFHSRFAVVLSFVAASSLTILGCATDDVSAPSDEAFEDADGSSGLGLGARGEEVRSVYDYLRQYGYFQNEELAEHYPNWTPAVLREPADPEVFDDAIEEAVELFQAANGLPVTGVVDDEMQQVMKMPRCSFPDYYNPPNMIHFHEPHYFTAQGSTWANKNLSYRFANYTGDMSQGDVRSQVQNALFSWTSSSAVSFTEVGSGENLTLGFYSGDHGDGSPFDGSSGVLAHAYYPAYGGDIHFDDAETWSTSAGSGKIHLETVALHEMGHSLGLGHSGVSSAVMYAYYGGARTSLTDDDRAGIWSLYGAFSAPTSTAILQPGQGLSGGQSIWSWDGRFEFAMQGDGNLVLYKQGSPKWASGTNGKGGDRVIMQEDGNLVIYKSNGQPVWASNTNGSSNYGSSLNVQNDGNVVIYRPNGAPIWATNTCCQ